MLRTYVADLHVHSALSPCATYRMAPTMIVRQAMRRGIDILAVTDHNSAENVESLVLAAAASSVRILPGMEVETSEEVHLVVMFDTVEQALQWQEFVYAHLPPLENDERLYGVQLALSQSNQFLHKVSRRLITPTDLNVDTVVERAKALGGFCVPAHVDRPSYSIISNLGFIPDTLDVPALELSPNAKGPLEEWTAGRVVIRSSDAHDLPQIGICRTMFLLAEPTAHEIQLACREQMGRRVVATKGSVRRAWEYR